MYLRFFDTRDVEIIVNMDTVKCITQDMLGQDVLTSLRIIDGTTIYVKEDLDTVKSRVMDAEWILASS